MNERLHPLTLGEILDRTAQLYRSRFLVFAGIAIIPALTVLVFAGAAVVLSAWAGLTAANLNVTAIVGLVLLGLIALPVWLGLTVLGWAAVTEAATQAFLGEAITIRGAYRSAWQHKVRHTGLYLLIVLIVVVAPMVVFNLLMMVSVGIGVAGRLAGGDAAAGAIAGVGILLGFVGVGIYMVWMLLRVCLAFPACVVEQISPWSAIKRSTLLSQGTKGRIVVLFLLGAALSWIVAMVVMIPMLIAIALIPGLSGQQHAQGLSIAIALMWYGLVFVVMALIRPIYGIALTVFYFDQRIRTEGFDIEWMMREAGMTPPETAPKQEIPWLSAVPAPLQATAPVTVPIAGSLDPEPPKAGEPA